jgi:hypothetical protein
VQSTTAIEPRAAEGQVQGENGRVVSTRRRLLDPRLAQVELARLRELGGVRIATAERRLGGEQPWRSASSVTPPRDV